MQELFIKFLLKAMVVKLKKKWREQENKRFYKRNKHLVGSLLLKIKAKVSLRFIIITLSSVLNTFK